MSLPDTWERWQSSCPFRSGISPRDEYTCVIEDTTEIEEYGGRHTRVKHMIIFGECTKANCKEWQEIQRERKSSMEK